MAKQSSANIDAKNRQVTVTNHETDAPVLPIAQIEKLHQFRPDRVDWVFDQTQIEAEYRREMTQRVNFYTFIERLVGQVFALIIGLSGIFGGVYAAMSGHTQTGTIISTSAIVGLAAVFIKGRSKR